ncbi:MAG: fibronectin type III domain-containing protein [Candidatus Berkelbacteria bacterium]|nr:fibronectin type III domain-containing protein [Candidatus Berkelbacteria bacterium]
MKKFFVLFAASILVLCSFSYAEAGPSIDQQYTAGDGSVSIESSLGRFAQTFKPTYTTLEKVEIELTNIVGSKSMSISIRHRTGLNWDTGNVLTTPVQTITNGWNTFDFDNITVGITANDSYGIFTNCSQEGPQWKYSSGPSVFSKGYAIWQSIDKPDWDYNFKTWGSNPVDIVAENTQATDGQNTATGSTETLGTTSASIAKPTTLTAIYSDNGKGVKLNWKASTTVDIDGYKVFRSESASGTPAKIASIAKGTLEYLDIDVITGKTYYYQVRAYKGDSQSVSSNIASATVPADAAPAKPMHLKVVDRTYTMLEVMWRKNQECKYSRLGSLLLLSES